MFRRRTQLIVDRRLALIAVLGMAGCEAFRPPIDRQSDEALAMVAENLTGSWTWVGSCDVVWRGLMTGTRYPEMAHGLNFLASQQVARESSDGRSVGRKYALAVGPDARGRLGIILVAEYDLLGQRAIVRLDPDTMWLEALGADVPLEVYVRTDNSRHQDLAPEQCPSGTLPEHWWPDEPPRSAPPP